MSHVACRRTPHGGRPSICTFPPGGAALQVPSNELWDAILPCSGPGRALGGLKG